RRFDPIPLRESLRSRASFEALHAREQLVLDGKRQEGCARAGTTGGFRRSFGGLFFHSRRGDQAARIGTHNGRWKNRLCHCGILKPGTARAPGKSRLVSCQKLWWVREGFKAISWRFPFCCVFTCSRRNTERKDLARPG